MKNHLCLAFEAMDINLRQLIKKHISRGLVLKSIRIYGYKLLKSIFYLKKMGIVHADIKPDNILVNESKSTIKLADLGSAFESDEEIILTPEIGSRYYRSPEVILGLPYSHPIDMFSFGASIFELVTGDIMLRSDDNNHHLELLMQITGMLPKKIIQSGAFNDIHFDEDCNFLKHVTDKATQKTFFKRKNIPMEPTRSLLHDLKNSFPQEDQNLINELNDLILKCLKVEPSERITPTESLKHPFFVQEEIDPENSLTTKE